MTRGGVIGLALAGALPVLWLSSSRAQTEVQRLGQDPEAKSTATSIGGHEPPPPVAGADEPALYGADHQNGKEGEGNQPETTTQTGTQPGPVPEMHVVQKGETLWDICQKYFQDPWRWPQLWAENPLITNPHWIFPGDVLRLLAASEAAPPAATPTAGGPKIKRTGDQYTGVGVGLREWGFVDPRELATGAEINGSREEKVMLSSGDSAYVAFPEATPLHAGERYSIYRPVTDAPVTDPETGKLLGYMVFIIGDIQIEQITDGRMARGTLLDLVEPAERGYKVGPLFHAFRNIEPKASAVSLEARIVSSIHPHKFLAEQMLAVINQGRTGGVEVGNRFFIVRRGDGYKRLLEAWEARDPRFPKEVVGELMAVDVRDNLTIAFVVRGTKEMRIGDVGEMRRGY